MANKGRKSLGRVLLRLGLILLLLLALGIGGYFLFRHLGFDKFKDTDEFRAYIASFGAGGPVIFILLSFLQVTFIPLPSTVTVVAGTFLFGPWLSFLYSFIGIFAGACLAFWLGRLIGKRFVAFIAGDEETVDKWLGKIEKRENVVLGFMFVFPFFPDDVLCALAGITKMKFWVFAIMQVVSRSIQLGYTVALCSGELIPFSGWGIPVWIAIVALLLVLLVLCFIYGEKIQDFLLRSFNRLFRKRNKDGEKDGLTGTAARLPFREIGKVMNPDVGDRAAKDGEQDKADEESPDPIGPAGHKPGEEDERDDVDD